MMNKEQSILFKMFVGTQDYLDANTTVWTSVPRIVTYKNLLDELIARIVEKNQESISVLPVTERKTP